MYLIDISFKFHELHARPLSIDHLCHINPKISPNSNPSDPATPSSIVVINYISLGAVTIIILLLHSCKFAHSVSRGYMKLTSKATVSYQILR
jgi:hypothetical protein